MPFPDPFKRDDEPFWVEPGPLEYWIVAVLLVGAWAYGIWCGVRSLF